MGFGGIFKRLPVISWRTLLVIELFVFASFVLLSTYLATKSPNGSILLDTPDASWIMMDRRYSLNSFPKKINHSYFLNTFEIDALPDTVELHIRSFRNFKIWVNGHKVKTPGSGLFTGANDEAVINIAPYLIAGVNQVLIRVSNQNGPPALLAYSPAIDLKTDQTWLSGKEPHLVALATRKLSKFKGHPLNTNSSIKTIDIQRVSMHIILLFGLGFLLTIYFNVVRPEYERKIFSIQVVYWCFLTAWIVLYANNLFKLPHHVGFDVSAHEDYVRYIAQQGRLPLASEGWQMFQSPLFYLLSAPIYSIAENWFGSDRAWYALRLLPMVSGLVILEMSYRCSLLVFKDRRDLQFVSFCVSASIPMMYYATQVTGNEPLSGALTAILIYCCFKYLDDSSSGISMRPALVLGVLFGLALLTKVTVVLLLPVLFAVYWRIYVKNNVSVRHAKRAGIIFFTVSGLVSGWYFLRNWLYFGRPFVEGWNVSGGISWWQDPGYRMLSDLFHFGHVLVSPIYAAISGFWDGVYSTLWLDGYLSSAALVKYAPPWNYAFMVILAWLAFPMTLALIVGMLKTLRWGMLPVANALQIAAASVVCYLLGMIYLYMQLPIYSTIKSTYALGTVPCLGLLVAYGASGLLSHLLLRAVIGGFLMVWVGFVYISFFVR